MTDYTWADIQRRETGGDPEEEPVIFEAGDNSIIVIDETTYKVFRITDNGYLPLIETECGKEFYLASSEEEASKQARRYWEDLANQDAEEFITIIGYDRAVDHIFGRGENIFEHFEEYPDETWCRGLGLFPVNAVSDELYEELPLCPTVAYRWS